ncbi:MAG: KpsF/GutQ family sugar-phosphate isomerase [Candidatus Omnitrophica bacterium]|nr:KpsF/GutQ family sugar-phosphate isomerase [Candidatus Omnitrophota bacterium]
MSITQIGKRVLRIEADAVRELVGRVDKDFEKAVKLMVKCRGRIIVTGMGKPGFIARKIAATLSSTGKASIFLHPAEAVHGDLGLVKSEDLVMIISNSGETDEVLRMLSTIRKINAPILALTGNAESTLARHADVVLNIGIRKEACPYNLVPTASTTVALAMGDALAVAMYQKVGFAVEDFALYHPGGSLARRLLRVKDIMRKGVGNPVVCETTPVRKALLKITGARAGSCTVVDEKGRLRGIFTDGDLRRHLENGRGEEILKRKIYDVATRKPVCVTEDQLAADALRILRQKSIDEVPVVDKQGKVVGLLDVQDLLRAGFV